MNKIYILIESLHYEARDTVFKHTDRERLPSIRKEYKNNWWVHRVTEKAFYKAQETQERQTALKEYDKSIMEKYNVGPEYRQNRWFMEQVRPTLY